MPIPFKTETDAFRVAAALGLLLGVSIVVGALSSPPYGVVVFAAGCAAGLVFELSGRETVDHGLRDAASAPHPHGPGPGKRHILVVAERTLAGEELRRELQPDPGIAVELDVLSPVLASRDRRGRGISIASASRRRCGSASLAWSLEARLRRPYGGAVVKGHGLMAIVWVVVLVVVWLRFARRPGRSRGSRRVVMLIFGGWPKTSVRRTSAV